MRTTERTGAAPTADEDQMLQALEWDEDEALTRKRVPEPIAETLRGFSPRITIIGMPAVRETEPKLQAPPPPAPQELEWDDYEGITQQCTPFFDEDDEPECDEEASAMPSHTQVIPPPSQPSWEHEDEVTVPVHASPPPTPYYYAPPPNYAPPPTHGSVPPMAMDAPMHVPGAPESRWSKLAAVSSALALAAMVGVLALFLLPRTGELRIELDHQGPAQHRVEIYVDGQKRCDTDPCIVSDLQPGARAIKVLVPGAAIAVESSGEVRPGEMRVVSVRVPAAQGVKVQAAHDGVRLWVDGKERGSLPAEISDLAPGVHRLRFEAGERYAPLSRIVDVPAGSVVDLGEIALEVRSVGLRIELGTPEARVQLVGPDGRVSTVAGPFPATVELSPGRYRIVGSKPGYAPHAETVHLGKKADHTLRLSLSPLRARRITPPIEPPISIEPPIEPAPEAAPPPELPPDVAEIAPPSDPLGN